MNRIRRDLKRRAKANNVVNGLILVKNHKILRRRTVAHKVRRDIRFGMLGKRDKNIVMIMMGMCQEPEINMSSVFAHKPFKLGRIALRAPVHCDELSAVRHQQKSHHLAWSAVMQLYDFHRIISLYKKMLFNIILW